MIARDADEPAALDRVDRQLILELHRVPEFPDRFAPSTAKARRVPEDPKRAPLRLADPRRAEDRSTGIGEGR